MAGRRRKPTALRILQGNPGKRPLPESEPTPTGKAVMPNWMTDYPKAVAVWEEMAPITEGMGLLTDADVPAFARYCTLQSEFRKDPDKFPASRMLRLDSLESRFGLDPSARAKLGSSGKKRPSNPFADLASG